MPFNAQPEKTGFRFAGISAGLIAALTAMLAGKYPGATEQMYSEGWFAGFRWVWDVLAGWLPAPWVVVELIVVTLLIFRFLPRIKTMPYPRRFFSAGLGLCNTAGYVYAAFMLLWGYNYHRIPLESKLGLQENTVADSLRLSAEIAEILAAAEASRAALNPPDSAALVVQWPSRGDERALRNAVESCLHALGYPTHGNVRCKLLYPAGLLTGMGATGIYIPFAGEGYVDAAVHPLLRPAVMAHEMAHGYGFADEGVCNFLSLIATEQHENPLVQYSGRLEYLRYLLSDMARINADAARQWKQSFSKGLAADLEALRAHSARYRPWFPNFSRKTYNRYLQAQGVKAGILSYNRLVQLAIGWKDKQRGLHRIGGEMQSP